MPSACRCCIAALIYNKSSADKLASKKCESAEFRHLRGCWLHQQHLLLFYAPTEIATSRTSECERVRYRDGCTCSAAPAQEWTLACVGWTIPLKVPLLPARAAYQQRDKYDLGLLSREDMRKSPNERRTILSVEEALQFRLCCDTTKRRCRRHDLPRGAGVTVCLSVAGRASPTYALDTEQDRRSSEMARAYFECTAGYKSLLLCADCQQVINLSAIHASFTKT